MNSFHIKVLFQFSLLVLLNHQYLLWSLFQSIITRNNDKLHFQSNIIKYNINNRQYIFQCSLFWRTDRKLHTVFRVRNKLQADFIGVGLCVMRLVRDNAPSKVLTHNVTLDITSGYGICASRKSEIVRHRCWGLTFVFTAVVLWLLALLLSGGQPPRPSKRGALFWPGAPTMSLRIYSSENKWNITAISICFQVAQN